MRLILSCALVLASALPAAAKAAKPRESESFAFRDADSQDWALPAPGRRALLFVAHSQDCPLSLRSLERLKHLAGPAARKDIPVFLVDAMSPPALRGEAEAAARRAKVRYVPDADKALSRLLRLGRTAQAVLIDARSRRVLYDGPLDERLGYDRDHPLEGPSRLESVFARLLRGEAVEAQPSVPSLGCIIPD